MQDYSGIFFDSLVGALMIHVGDEVLVTDMKYDDAVMANLWPAVPDRAGVILPRIDWKKAYKRKLHSSRYGRYVLLDSETDQNLAAVRMGVTKNADRIAITHMSRNMGDGRLGGMMAQIGITSLLLSQERVRQLYGHTPDVAILNPLPGALPHYVETAAAMDLDHRFDVAGNTSLLYIESKKSE